jgi:hypothetical protein
LREIPATTVQPVANARVPTGLYDGDEVNEALLGDRIMALSRRCVYISVLSIVASYNSVLAQTDPDLVYNRTLASSLPIRIFVDDQVKDGCLRNPSSLANRAQVKMIQGGLIVTEEASSHRLTIDAIGFRVNNKAKNSIGCVVSYRLEYQVNTIFGYTPLFLDNGIITSPDDVQQDMIKWIEEAVDKLLLAIYAARREIKEAPQ